MKTIGLVGGTGWVSTHEYYRLINEMTNKKLGGLNAAKSLIYSVNYAEINELNKVENLAGVLEMIKNAALVVEQGGAECLLLCANTLHQFVDGVNEAINIPIIHIGEATALKISERGMTKVGLLGTRYTMEMDFYHEKLNARGIEGIVPDKTEREFIHNCIMNELLVEDFKEESKRRFLKIIDQLEHEGAEGIILGCTEIPLLIKQHDCRLPLFNTTEIHAEAAVEFALSDH